MSELIVQNQSKVLIVCFGGMALKMGGVLPFEFLNFLSTNYEKKYDYMFYIDKNQSWYHKGIEGISGNIKETVKYLKKKIRNGKYEKVIFMGVSAGGYASILFGSLCKVNFVISFIPRTIINNPIDEKYKNIKKYINNSTKYIVYGDLSIEDVNASHHVSQVRNLSGFNNIKIVEERKVKMKKFVRTGRLKVILDNIIEN